VAVTRRLESESNRGRRGVNCARRGARRQGSKEATMSWTREIDRPIICPKEQTRCALRAGKRSYDYDRAVWLRAGEPVRCATVTAPARPACRRETERRECPLARCYERHRGDDGDEAQPRRRRRTPAYIWEVLAAPIRAAGHPFQLPVALPHQRSGARWVLVASLRLCLPPCRRSSSSVRLRYDTSPTTLQLASLCQSVSPFRCDGFIIDHSFLAPRSCG
jgi:hypothetical protein